MKKTFFAVFIFSFVILFASLAFAVPVEINYQGYLTDSNGLPVNDTPDIRFRLYNDATQSQPVSLKWDSGDVSVSVEKGVYSLILGETPQPAIDPAIFSEQLWLSIEVESQGEMTPRQKLTSVGFSIRALSAETVADGAVTNATITGPISSTKIEQGPGSTLDADTVDGKHAADLQDRVTGTCGPGGSISTVNADGSVVCEPTGLTGTLTNNYVPRSDGTGLVNSTIFDNGSVGIGITNPVAKIDVLPGIVDFYGNWISYGYYPGCPHCYDTCDGNDMAEYACPVGVSLTCEDLRNSDGESWDYRSVECDQLQQAARLRGDVTANGTVNATTLAVNDVTATGTVTADNLTGDGTNVTNVNAALLEGQNSSQIISAASDEVRTPVSSCGVTISTPGSYYVTQNLSTTDTCITIASNDVTLDLMGFVLTGDGSGISDTAIFFDNASNVKVINGTVKNFHDGISFTNANTASIFDVRAVGNTYTGISVNGSGNIIIKNCIAAENGHFGISAANAVIDSNVAINNGDNGIQAIYSTTSNNTSINNTYHGFTGSGSFTNNIANANGGDGFSVYSGTVFSNNYAINNQHYGIELSGGNLVTNNSAYNNNQAGGYANMSACPSCVFGINLAP